MEIRKGFNMNILLQEIKDTLQHIVDSEEWDTLQEGSSAEDMIKEIEIKLKEQKQCNQ